MHLASSLVPLRALAQSIFSRLRVKAEREVQRLTALPLLLAYIFEPHHLQKNSRFYFQRIGINELSILSYPEALSTFLFLPHTQSVPVVSDDAMMGTFIRITAVFTVVCSILRMADCSFVTSCSFNPQRRQAFSTGVNATVVFTLSSNGMLPEDELIILTYPEGFFVVNILSAIIGSSSGAYMAEVVMSSTNIRFQNPVDISAGAVVTITILGLSFGAPSESKPMFLENSYGDTDLSLPFDSGYIGDRLSSVSFFIADSDRFSGKSQSSLVLSFITSAGGGLVIDSLITVHYPPGFFIDSGPSNVASTSASVSTFTANVLQGVVGSSSQSFVLKVTGGQSPSPPSMFTITISGLTMGLITLGSSTGFFVTTDRDAGTDAIQRVASGPIRGSLGPNQPAVTLSNVEKGINSVTMTITLTPVSPIAAGHLLVITLGGSAPQSLSSFTTVFKSPTSGMPVATTSVAGGVLTVSISGGTFNANSLVEILLGNVMNPSSALPAQNGVLAAVVASSRLCQSDSGTFPAILDSSLNPPPHRPAITLNNVIAASSSVSMTIAVTPLNAIPNGGRLHITLTGAFAFQISTGTVVVVEPTLGTPAATAAISGAGSGTKLTVTFSTGTLAGGERVILHLPGTVTNPASTAIASSSLQSSITTSSNVILETSNSGTCVAIVSGSLGTNAPSISLSNVAKNTGSVTMTISLTPADAVPTGSTLLITLGGSAPQSLSASTVVFTSPGTGSPAAAAGVAGGVLAITITGGALSAGSLIVLTLPGTVTNPTHVQSALGNVASCIISSQVIIASSSTGTHPAVIPPYMPVVFMIDILRD
jgi:hypothetical protein